MDIMFTASIRCAHKLQGGVKDGRECGKEAEFEGLAGEDVTRGEFVDAAANHFHGLGWLVGPPKDCRCPGHC